MINSKLESTNINSLKQPTVASGLEVSDTGKVPWCLEMGHPSLVNGNLDRHTAMESFQVKMVSNMRANSFSDEPMEEAS